MHRMPCSSDLLAQEKLTNNYFQFAEFLFLAIIATTQKIRVGSQTVSVHLLTTKISVT